MKSILALVPLVSAGCVDYPADDTCAATYGGAAYSGADPAAFGGTCAGGDVMPLASIGAMTPEALNAFMTAAPAAFTSLGTLQFLLSAADRFDSTACQAALQALLCHSFRPKCTGGSVDRMPCDVVDNTYAACKATASGSESAGLFEPSVLRAYLLPGGSYWADIVPALNGAETAFAIWLSNFANPASSMKVAAADPLAQYSCVAPAGLPWFHPENPINSGNSSEDCKDKSGVDYRGMMNATSSGHSCLSWEAGMTGMNGKKTASGSPLTGLGDHTYCRNPDAESAPWCYFWNPTLSTAQWEVCNASCGTSDYVAIPATFSCDLSPASTLTVVSALALLALF